MSQTTDIMNCDDYQEALTANPDFEDEHVHGCADCQAYSSELLAMNERIAAAMAISVPDLIMPELPDLDTDNVVSLSSRRAISMPMWLAMAASVVLAVIVGVQVSDPAFRGVPLEEQVLAHVDHEPSALLPSSTPVADGKLNKVVPKTIAAMNHDTGLITFAETCPINGKDVPHLVIQGERGPITILILPDEEISETKELNGESVFGYLIKVGDGSIAIIGERDEQLDQVKQNVINSVAWDI